MAIIDPISNITIGGVALDGVQSIEGLIGLPDVRRNIIARAEMDGQLISGTSFWDARTITIQGTLTGSPASMHATWRAIKNALVASLNGGVTLSFVLNGDSEAKTMSVRVVGGIDAPLEAGPNKLTYDIVLLAPDPRMFSLTQHSVSDTSSPFSVAATNAGNVTTWPQINIAGPITDPVLTNTTAGKNLTFNDDGGLTVPDGSTLIVKFNPSTGASATISGANKMQYIDFTTSEFFALLAGANTITLSGSGTGGNTALTVIWNDAWL